MEKHHAESAQITSLDMLDYKALNQTQIAYSHFDWLLSHSGNASKFGIFEHAAILEFEDFVIWISGDIN